MAVPALRLGILLGVGGLALLAQVLRFGLLRQITGLGLGIRARTFLATGSRAGLADDSLPWRLPSF
jgi:hypothetical protein